MTKRLLRRSLCYVTLLAFLLASGPAFAQKGGKGGGKGGDDGGTSDPPTTPVSYVLDTVAVEGYYPFPFSANSADEVLYSVTVAEVTQQVINTDAYRTAAIVDIATGQVSYLDNLLTQPTIWTVLGDGVESVRFTPSKINHHGDVIGVAVETVNGESQPPVGFLLQRTIDAGGNVAYQPTNLGVSNLIFLNDAGEIYGQDLDGHFIRYNDGSKLYIDDLNLPLPMGTAYDLNNTGTFFGSTISDSEIGRFDFLLDIDTLEITYIDEFNNVRDWPGQSLSDSGVTAGSKRVFYEYKERGKTRTGSYRIPAIVDPEFGPQSFDNPDRIDFGIVTMNHQRLNGESTLLAHTGSGDGTRQLWLKLPATDSFFLHDALSVGDQAVWQSITNGKQYAQVLTPLNTDGSIAHSAKPSIVGPLVTGFVDNEWVAPGFWVLRPTP